jgi:glycogen debranching enzyme
MLENRIVLKENRIMMVSDSLGDIPANNDLGFGLYYSDTRFLSHYEFHVNHEKPILLSASVDQSYVATFQMVNPLMPATNGERIPRQSISIRRTRFIYDGLHERVGLQNCASLPVQVECAFDFDADFRDIFDVRSYKVQARGRQHPRRLTEHGLFFEYDGLDQIKRCTDIIFERIPTSHSPQGAVYELLLQPKQTVTLVMDIIPRIGAESAPMTHFFDQTLRALHDSYQGWENSSTEFSTDNAFLDQGLVRRSRMDLRILTEEYATGPFPVAGIPWYSTPFGRDSLITSIQTLGLNPELARGTLRYLALRQGKVVDLAREEQPGKILHELRSGELANLKQIPHTPYYGSVDSTPLFLVLLVETMNWLDDEALFQELTPAAMAALEWIDRYGDLDGDGFIEYEAQVAGGLRNQGWKDSRDSLQYEDGRLVELPAALVEVQGYVYHAKAALARICAHHGDAQIAERLTREARVLRERFEQAFWSEAEGFYAQGLDREKRHVGSVSSNPGHCLWSGIISPARAARVAERLLAPDMFSGWGIRTLASSSPNYNPMSYHNGTIWPHDNALIAVGLRRYGQREAAQKLIAAIIEAGFRMPSYRLPELYCGFNRDYKFNSNPAEYLVSCNPQAWGAGTVFQLLQTVLGITPDAGERRLYLKPMPLPLTGRIAVDRMRVGSGRFSFTVAYGPQGEPTIDVREQPKDFEVVLADPPWVTN